MKREPAKDFQDLIVWQKAHQFVLSSYHFSGSFPSNERYGLTSQFRRSAISIPANIAEGYARTHRGDYLRHLSIARGSLSELETHLTIAARLEYIEREQVVEVWNMTQEVGKMLTKLVKSLRESQTLNPKP